MSATYAKTDITRFSGQTTGNLNSASSNSRQQAHPNKCASIEAFIGKCGTVRGQIKSPLIEKGFSPMARPTIAPEWALPEQMRHGERHNKIPTYEKMFHADGVTQFSRHTTGNLNSASPNSRQQATGNRQQATGNRQQAIIHIL